VDGVMNDTTPLASEHRAFPTSMELRVFRVAAMAVCLTVIVLLVALALWGLAEVMSLFKPLLLPLAVAGVIALVLHPATQTLHRLTHIPTALIAGITVAAVVGLTVLATFLLVPMLIEQGYALYREVVSMAVSAHGQLALRYPEVGEYLQQQVQESDVNEVIPPLESAVEYVGPWLSLLMGLVFAPLFLFFFLLAGPKVQRHFAEQTEILGPELHREVNYLSSVFANYVAAFFRGQLIIALTMAVMYSAGFMMIGLDAALALGVISGFLNIVPFLGTVVGLLLVLPYAWMQGDGGVGLAATALAVFLTVQIIESWVLTPRIMSNRSGLHPSTVILSLLFWGILLGGVIGVILAVPLSAFLATLWHQIRYHYARRVVGDFGTCGIDGSQAPDVGDSRAIGSGAETTR
jgi:predicted PurR-regulated permease PerM